MNRNKLRPQNLWNNEKRKDDKDKEKPKRPSRAKKQRAHNELTSDVFGSQCDAPSDALAVPAQDESAESPADPGSTTEAERAEEPELPSLVRQRARDGGSDLPPTEMSPENFLDPSAYAALERAIRSSPNRLSGAKSSPVNLDQATPDPARRKLFSSPKTSGPLGVDALNNAQAKPMTSNEPGALGHHQTITVEGGQEMLPARSATPDSFQELTKALAPVTPSKTNTNSAVKSPSDLFKTPSNKSAQSQQRISTNDFFSSAAKAFLHGPTTPSRTPSKTKTPQNLHQMTPFTRSLNLLLSEASGHDSSPSRFMGILGDVRALPPLTNENNGPMDFDFSDFNPTSDLGLTSSPPRWYGPSEDATDGGIWEDVGFGSSPAKASEKADETLQETAAASAAA